MHVSVTYAHLPSHTPTSNLALALMDLGQWKEAEALLKKVGAPVLCICLHACTASCAGMAPGVVGASEWQAQAHPSLGTRPLSTPQHTGSLPA